MHAQTSTERLNAIRVSLDSQLASGCSPDEVELECGIDDYRRVSETVQVCKEKLIRHTVERVLRSQENNSVQAIILLNKCEEALDRVNQLKAKLL